MQADSENKLVYQSNNDELTGLYNRRAYEEDMLNYKKAVEDKDFVYATIDLNGLKQVNDELGHSAGDELIKGAATCIEKTIGKLGRVYRTGGDEFVAMFIADEEQTQIIFDRLKAMADEWRMCNGCES